MPFLARDFALIFKTAFDYDLAARHFLVSTRRMPTPLRASMMATLRKNDLLETENGAICAGQQRRDHDADGIADTP